jgi:hypothetical protein
MAYMLVGMVFQSIDPTIADTITELFLLPVKNVLFTENRTYISYSIWDLESIQVTLQK